MTNHESHEAQLVKEHAGLVVSQALIFHPTKLTGYDDYIQVGYIGLLKAIRNFDPNRGTKFSTFATACIRSEIIREIRRNSPEQNLLVDVSGKDVKETDMWEVLIDNLTETEKHVLHLRVQGYTYQEIGDTLGFTKSWASETMNNLIGKLKEANKCQRSESCAVEKQHS